MRQRLNKLIAHSGLCSRRKADELILKGKVKINGSIVLTPGISADPDKDKITVNNTPLMQEKMVYILLHKPPGYITTTKDAHADKTVLSLLPKLPVRLYPVGRLDKDTSGLLIMTNDGQLRFKLTHPKFEVDRVYEVVIRKPLPEDIVNKIEKGGLQIDDYKTYPCKIKILSRTKTTTTLRIILHEGRKRQIRKVFSSFGHPVIELKRVQFGKLHLGDLKPGKWRFLKKSEII
ncbi:MAG: pseudouridine synthase [Candidatus Omnitrophota bacterium]